MEIITLFDVTHMMSMVNPGAVSVKTLRIGSWRSFEKEFTKLIYVNS